MTLTTQEVQFVVNLLLSPDMYVPQPDPVLARQVANKLSSATNLTTTEVGFLQAFLQDQSEIYGRRSSTANEKTFGNGHLTGFIPTQSLILIKSISDKLGADLKVNRDDRSDVNSPRQEGSRSIMKDPNLK